MKVNVIETDDGYELAIGNVAPWDCETVEVSKDVAIKVMKIINKEPKGVNSVWVSVLKGVEPEPDTQIEVTWVNLEHENPYWGVDIISSNDSFVDYKTNHGRTITRWRRSIVESMILPDEVVDEDSLFEYMRVSAKPQS